MGSQSTQTACLCRSACPAITEACDFISISWMRKDMAVEEPKRTEYSSYGYVLAPTAFRANARDAKYR
jgi:hypothetical protein